MGAIDVVVSEVGPRDGLQSVKQAMPTAIKHKWIAALAASGLSEIEVGSFVSPKRLPQMADAAEVVEKALLLPKVSILALVPNLKGAERAVAAGLSRVTVPVSASREHSMKNIGMTPEEAVEQVRKIHDMAKALPAGRELHVEVGISTAFGCTMEGPVSEDWVMKLAAMLAEAGAESIGLSDTTGYANTAQVKRMYTRLIREIGDLAGGAHIHNTRGLGLANILAALDAGVRTFDSSQGGLGGCPYAPGASGNVVTEDLVYMLEAMGLRTGVDIDRLLAAREIIKEGLPGEPLYGLIPDAGLPKGFVPASEKA